MQQLNQEVWSCLLLAWKFQALQAGVFAFCSWESAGLHCINRCKHHNARYQCDHDSRRYLHDSKHDKSLSSLDLNYSHFNFDCFTYKHFPICPLAATFPLANIF